jgi:hypothetical protein
MIKILGRTLAILAAAMVVVGALIAFWPTSAAGELGGRFPERGAFVPGQPAGPAFGGAAGPNAGTSPAEFRGGRERGRSPGLFAAGELLRSLLVISVVVAIVAPIAHLLRKRRTAVQFRRPPQPGSASST